MADFTDVEVRIRGAKSGGGGKPSVHDVEVSVGGSGVWIGESKFDFDSLDPSEPDKYGVALGSQLANPSLLRALDQAGLTRGGCIRLRLRLDDDVKAPHWIRWERTKLFVSGVPWSIATHPRVVLSRYIPVQQPDGDPPDTSFFQLLFAVANPVGLKPEQEIDVEKDIGKFLEEFERASPDRRLQVSFLPGRTGITQALEARIAAQGWNVQKGCATLQNLSDLLHQKYNGLHILAHGDFNPDSGVGSLLLENDTGGKNLVDDSALQSWVTQDLQLIVFHACLGAGMHAEGGIPFTGLAPRLILQGVPAAVAMQDYVEMEDARTFFSEFYRTLLDGGLVDVAVNRGRQRLIRDSTTDNWSIPALFSRLRGGKLWQADPIRQAILAALDNLPFDEGDKWPRLQVTEHGRGLSSYDPLAGASGPCFDLWQRTMELAAVPGSFVILTGAAGSSKGAQLRRLFREMGEQFRNAKPDLPQPVLLSMSDLASRAPDSWPVLERIWTGTARQPDLARIQGRHFLFLVDAEMELTGPLRERALTAINRLQALPGSRVIMVADEPLLPALGNVESPTLLVVQPLDFSSIVTYLEDLNTDAAKRVLEAVRTGGHRDLASQALFLQYMVGLASRGIPLKSRRAILESVAADCLSRTDTRRVPRICIEAAAQAIAWEVQSGRGGELDGERLYSILNAARGDRDFPLSDLQRALVEDCGLLTPSGGEGLRFTYLLMQAYFAARYLAGSTDRTRLLEDITASLGRLARARRWDKVLVLLAGMLPNPAELIGMVLAGSSLLEGEQLFLAVRCYQEAIAGGKDTEDLDNVVDQLVDSLIWRCSWNPSRPYGDRRAALEHLIELAVACPARRGDIIPHLIALACDPIPRASGGPGARKYDWSGIRRAATYGLTRLDQQTTDYVAEHRPDLVNLLRASSQLREQPEAMKTILFLDDPRVSVIAAFALAQNREGGDVLIEAYEHCLNPDVKWGIADALSEMEAGWVQQNVLQRWFVGVAADDSEAAELRAAHTCYLIQKTRFASSVVRRPLQNIAILTVARAFLSRCLRDGSSSLQGRAIRAFAELQDVEIETWLRPLCEQILSRKHDQLDQNRIRLGADQIGDPRLQRAALEALRDIGNAGSLSAVRKARSETGDDELRQLSFQVAEEIYWRLSGGLDRESANVAAVQN